MAISVKDHHFYVRLLETDPASACPSWGYARCRPETSTAPDTMFINSCFLEIYLFGWVQQNKTQGLSHPYPWLLLTLPPMMVLHNAVSTGTDVLCIWGGITAFVRGISLKKTEHLLGFDAFLSCTETHLAKAQCK